MATTVQATAVAPASRVGVLRLAAATALAATAFMLLCWIGARLGLGPVSHMYIQLFSDAAPASVTALLLGLCYSVIGGLIAGALFAVSYNLFGFFEPARA